MENKLKNKIIIYQAKSGAIEARIDTSKETILLTQQQVAKLFNVKKAAISKHVKNIFEKKELDKKLTVSILETVQKEGDRTIKRSLEYYNLDLIISVGYRVNSVNATKFRIWATKTLKQHITKGYTINPKMIEKNCQSFLDAVEKVQKLLPKGNVIPAENVLELIKTFASTWFSLESYDEDNLPQKGFTRKDIQIQAEDLYRDIEKLKKQLIKKKQATKLFAQEMQKESLKGILGNVFQSVFGSDLYKTIEEKAAHLLYFTVKNHPFNDGNKRTGAFVFIWFLQRARFDFRGKITPEALTVITLFVAESKPSEKERMIGLILLMLKK